MAETYWSSILRQRLSRRRALAATGAGAAAAVLLAACGGDDSPSDSSSLITKAADTSAQAKKGGVWLDAYNTDATTFDPQFGNVSAAQLDGMIYSQLFKAKLGVLADPVFGSIEGDAAQSYELSPDKLTFTIKLRDNLTWHNLPPVNGRKLDAEDVVYSYQRFSNLGSNRSQFVGSLGGPIDSLTAIDTKTIQIKLNQVFAGFLAVLAQTPTGNLHMVPREAEDQSKLDIRRNPVGTGPWYLKDYQPSVGYTMARNEGWYDKDRAYVDEIRRPIIPEYATALAQFKAGAIYRYPLLRPEDVLSAKKENNALNLYLGPVRTLNGAVQRAGFCFYGWNPAYGAKTPFRDRRIRQAFSMAWDRDLWIDTFHNVEQLRAEGIPMETLWNSSLTTSEAGWYVNPQQKEFGPNAKYYEHNLADAKKLVEAAVGAGGVDIDAHYVTTGEYGIDFNRHVETLLGFGPDAGIRFKTVPANFATEWTPLFANSRGDFEGIAFRTGGIDHPDPVERLGKFAHPTFGGVRYTGFFSQDSSYQKGDPRLTTLIEKGRGEFDEKTRQGYVQDFQRIFAEEQYLLLYPGGSNTLSVAWPALQNESVYFGEQLQYVGLWIDPTKAPIAKS